MHKKFTVLTVNIYTMLVQAPLQLHHSPLAHTSWTPWKWTNITGQHFTLIPFTSLMGLVNSLNLPPAKQHPVVCSLEYIIEHKLSCTYNSLQAETHIYDSPMFIKTSIILQENWLLFKKGCESTVFSHKERERKVYSYKRKRHDALRKHNNTHCHVPGSFLLTPTQLQLCSLSASNFTAY